MEEIKEVKIAEIVIEIEIEKLEVNIVIDKGVEEEIKIKGKEEQEEIMDSVIIIKEEDVKSLKKRKNIKKTQI